MGYGSARSLGVGGFVDRFEQEGKEDDDGTANDVIPKEAKAGCKVEKKYGGLGDEGGDEGGVATDAFEEKGDKKNTEDRSIENGTEDIDGFDQVVEQGGKGSKRKSHESPKDGKGFGDEDIVSIGFVGADAAAVKVDHGGGSKGIEFAGGRAHGGE